MNLILVLNKTSPRAHTKLELNVLVVHKKLVKYVVHLSKKKIWNFFIFLHISCPNSKSTSFWSQGILGVKKHYVYFYFYNYPFIYKFCRINSHVEKRALILSIIIKKYDNFEEFHFA
jgi:hypothetical protein